MGKVTLGKGPPPVYFGLPLSVSFNQYSALHTALKRQTEVSSPGIFQKALIFPKSWRIGQKIISDFLFFR